MSFQHPVFAPYQDEITALGIACAFPGLTALNALAERRGLVNACNLPLHFSASQKPLPARDYEQHILQTGCIPTRTDNWHDVMNALVWLRFPQFKAALNAAHGAAIADEDGTQRGRRRDALTVLDESGVWVGATDARLIEMLGQRRWRELFWENREAARAGMQWIVVGHALLEKMLAPYPAITGKCQLLHLTRSAPDQTGLVDAQRQALAGLHALAAPDQLAPLPLLGIPEWDEANTQAVYYDNRAIFRSRV